MFASARQHRTKKKKDDPILLHKGRLASQILMTSKTETFTMSVGWTSNTVSAFVQAVNRLIQENPILTSRIIRKRGALYALPGYHTLENHKFVTVTDLTTTTNQSDIHPIPNVDGSYSDIIHWCHEMLTPMISSQAFLIVEIIKKIPLFDSNLFLLPNQVVVYHVNLSHGIGDATTYYKLMEHISTYMNLYYHELTQNSDTTSASTKPMPLPLPIVWSNPNITTHQSNADHCSKRDISRMTGMPFTRGLVRQGTTLPNRSRACILLSRKKINEYKQKLLDDGVAAANTEQTDNNNKPQYLSSHDIIIAALCEMNVEALDVVIHMDMRKRLPSLYSSNDGGNCFRQVTIPCSVVKRNPRDVRDVIQRGYYYETNQIPIEPSRTGKWLITTSWTTNACYLTGCGDTIRTVCHAPTMSIFRMFPLNLVVIFAVNEECLGIAHNFVDTHISTDPNLLLNALVYDDNDKEKTTMNNNDVVHSNNGSSSKD